MTVIFRPQRGGLQESMNEAVEFENYVKMAIYLVDLHHEQFGIDDIVVNGDPQHDERIGWKDVKMVCVNRYGAEDYIKTYGTPQVIGYCATDFTKRRLEMEQFRKFEVEVVTTNKYIIEFDTSEYTEQQMQEFRNYFFDLNTLEEHAENLAKQRVRLASRGDDFIEGYGHVRVIKGGFDSKDYPRVKDGMPVPLTDGITVKVVEEEEDFEVEVIEKKE